MIRKQGYCFCLVIAVLIFTAASCSKKRQSPAMFEALESGQTGLHFANRLNSSDSLNLFKYMYFYNGAGVAAGDFNNDGLVDIFFNSNQGDNSLYLNQGNMKFRDVTRSSGIPADKAWSTGVSVVDINNDGLLDLYISRLGDYQILKSKNQFLICQGIDSNGVPHYVDKAKEYGLDFSGFGSQAAFLDYDLDGDLDIFLLNHSVHENGTFRARSEFVGTFHPTTGSRLFRNDGKRFTDVTKDCGINSSAIGYGLGIAVSDINLDGYPDIYIGNDFHENDYMYINQRNGKFKDELVKSMMHTSQFTMGVDVADANNDGYPEIISMDMLPSDPYILKRSMGEDAYDIFNLKISYGYNYQYTRNNLQYNRRNGNFSETGLYSGVAATDWSWSPLWMDFDNDGLKDLFISNGIPKRMNDIDYINYVSDEQIQQKIKDNKIDEKDEALIERFPEIRIPNKFFRNTGQLSFADEENNIDNDIPTFSNGAVYADLDNDGDLDIVVNNIDEDAIIYRNTSNDKQDQAYARFHLKGDTDNVNAVGAKAILYVKGEVRTYEKFGTHGFLSSMEIPMQIGLGKNKADSAFLVWPDNTFQSLPLGSHDTTLIYHKGLPSFDYRTVRDHFSNPTLPVEDITRETGLAYLHTENTFAEFDREPLIPRMLSTEGPAVAVGDINKDGLDDIFMGSSKGFKSAVFAQQPSGKFVRLAEPALDADSMDEGVDACWVDVNNDAKQDLVVVSGGNEYYGPDAHLLPRLYLNDGDGRLVKKNDAFDGLYQTNSCVSSNDFNGDGYADLFIGGRAVPWDYGKKPSSFLLQNDGQGKFRDVTRQVAPELSDAGFVTGAIWCDIDHDGDKDLIVCSEWGTVDAYINTRGHFRKQVLFNHKGWWNFILPVDLNGDGNIDIIAGNLGLNSRLHASEKEPVRLYYNDFDDNGKKEQVLTYYLAGKEIPFANKSEMDRQMPVMRKRFLYAQDFAKATLSQILSPEKIASSDVLSADYFSNCILINKGNLQFEAQPMPWQAQLSSYRDAAIVDANRDSLPDIFLTGNFYGNNIEMGRYDADFGSLLVNRGNGKFDYESLNGLVIKGQARSVKKITVGGRESYLIARNNDSAMVMRFRKNGEK